MRKISILSLHLGYGGIERAIVSLANSLCSKYEIEIAVVYKLYDKSSFEIDNRVKVKYLNGNLKPNRDSLVKAINNKKINLIIKEAFYSFNCIYKRRKSIINYIKTTDSDVIISTRDIFHYWLSDYGRENVLKIGWEHNHHHGNDKYATNIINSAKGLDYFVLVSNDLEKYYSKKLAKFKCKCKYIPNTIDKIPLKTASLKEKNFVSVGRLSKEKGFLDLLKIYKVLVKKYPDWKLNIIGDGRERGNLEKFIKKNNLENSVILHGFQDREFIDNIFNKSAIYLMTSYTESFGIVLIEAMSHGLPCIAFDSAEGACEIINSGENGYLIKNRSFDAMILKIEDLIKNENERKRISKYARKSIQKYTSDNVNKMWIKLIEKGE